MTICVLFMLLAVSARTVSAQETLPLRDDDLDYARKLAASGFEDLATDILERIFAKPGLPAAQKQSVVRLLVESYRRQIGRAHV